MSSQEQFHRGLDQYKFIPKGQWITGVNVSFTQGSYDDFQFFIVENINGDNYSFKVSPMVMYCFKDNMAAGGRLSYKRSLIKLDKANVIMDSESSYDIDNLYSLSHNYYGMACLEIISVLEETSVSECLLKHSLNLEEVNQNCAMVQVMTLQVLLRKIIPLISELHRDLLCF